MEIISVLSLRNPIGLAESLLSGETISLCKENVYIILEIQSIIKRLDREGLLGR